MGNEAFQGVEATRHMAQKTGNNLQPKHRQPTEIGRKNATVCNRDNSLIIRLCFLCNSDIWIPNQTGDIPSGKPATKLHQTTPWKVSCFGS